MICRSCRLGRLRQSLSGRPRVSPASRGRFDGQQARTYSESYSRSRPVAPDGSSDIAAILSKPTWSVRSLLPPTSTPPNHHQQQEISPKTLRHLLRLSALPPPASPVEETELLNTLSSQLHFVQAIQHVDTTGVEPMRSVRDETSEGLKAQTIGLQELQDALGNEDIMGHARRPRRRRAPKMEPGTEDWNVLANASETVGPFFVVRSGTLENEHDVKKP